MTIASMSRRPAGSARMMHLESAPMHLRVSRKRRAKQVLSLLQDLVIPDFLAMSSLPR